MYGYKRKSVTDYSWCLRFFKGADKDICDLPRSDHFEGIGNGAEGGFFISGYSSPEMAMHAGLEYAREQAEKYGDELRKPEEGVNGFVDVCRKDGQRLFNISLDAERVMVCECKVVDEDEYEMEM